MKYLEANADLVAGSCMVKICDVGEEDPYSLLNRYRWVQFSPSLGFGGIVADVQHNTGEDSEGADVAIGIYTLTLYSKKTLLEQMYLPMDRQFFMSPTNYINFIFDFVKQNDATTFYRTSISAFSESTTETRFEWSGQSVMQALVEVCQRYDLWFHHEMRYYEDFFKFAATGSGSTALSINFDVADKEKQLVYSYSKELIESGYNRIINYTDYTKQFCVFDSIGEKYYTRATTGYAAGTWQNVLDSKYAERDQDIAKPVIAIRIEPLEVTIDDTDFFPSAQTFKVYPVKLPRDISPNTKLDPLTRKMLSNDALLLCEYSDGEGGGTLKYKPLECKMEIPAKVPANGLLPADEYTAFNDDIWIIPNTPPIAEAIEAAPAGYLSAEDLAKAQATYGATWAPVKKNDTEFNDFKLYALANYSQSGDELYFTKFATGQADATTPRRVKYNFVELFDILIPLISYALQDITNGSETYQIEYVEIDTADFDNFYTQPTNEFSRRCIRLPLVSAERFRYETPIESGKGIYSTSTDRISVVASRCFSGSKTFDLTAFIIDGRTKTAIIEGVKQA